MGVYIPRTKTTSIALKLSSKEWEIKPCLFVDIEGRSRICKMAIKTILVMMTTMKK